MSSAPPPVPGRAPDGTPYGHDPYDAQSYPGQPAFPEQAAYPGQAPYSGQVTGQGHPGQAPYSGQADPFAPSYASGASAPQAFSEQSPLHYPGAPQDSGLPPVAAPPGYAAQYAPPPEPPKKRGGFIAITVIACVLVFGLVATGGFFGLRAIGDASGGRGPGLAPGGLGAGGQPGPVVAADLEVGACILEPESGQAFVEVDCAEPHYAQLYAQQAITGDSYPGEQAIDDQAVPFCQDGSATGLDTSKLDRQFGFSYMAPDQQLWANEGERYVSCFVQRTDGELFTDNLLPTS